MHRLTHVSADLARQAAEGVVASAFACDADLARLVAASARYVDHAARTTIMESGAACDRLHLVVAGQARMLAYSIDGRLVMIEEFGSGDLFGEMAPFDAHAPSGEVCATLPTRAGVFEAAAFLGLMTRYAVIALAISRLLVSRLAAARLRLVETTTLSAAGRIHAELLRQARAGEAMTIRPAPVLATFALGVRSSRESVSRAINALQKRGIIRRDADSLTIVAPHRLEELIY